jgi:hypothetical protein
LRGRNPQGEQRESNQECSTWPAHVLALLDLDAELGGGLRHLAGDLRGAILCLLAERVGVLRREAMTGLLALVDAFDERGQTVEFLARLRRLVGIDLGDRRADVGIDDLQAAEDVVDVVEARGDVERRRLWPCRR